LLGPTLVPGTYRWLLGDFFLLSGEEVSDSVGNGGVTSGVSSDLSPTRVSGWISTNPNLVNIYDEDHRNVTSNASRMAFVLGVTLILILERVQCPFLCTYILL